MKTIKFLFTLMAAAVTTIAAGVENPKFNVIPVSTDRAVVTVKNENPALFEFRIEKKDGEMIYLKRTTDRITDYQKVFDFASLEPGAYVFQLKVNDTRISNNFEVTDVGIVPGESKLRYDPYFDFNDQVLKMTYLNFDQEALELTIYGKKGPVYESELGSDFNIARGYDLSKLDKGSYRVVLSSAGNEFIYSLKK